MAAGNLWNAGAAVASNNGIAVNAALTDSLVTDFGGAATSAAIPADWNLCIEGIWYDAVAAVAVRIYLASALATTEDNRQTLLDSAVLTAPPDHWVGPSFNVPRTQVIVGNWQPHLLLITKDVGDAKVRVKFSWKPPGVC